MKIIYFIMGFYQLQISNPRTYIVWNLVKVLLWFRTVHLCMKFRRKIHSSPHNGNKEGTEPWPNITSYTENKQMVLLYTEEAKPPSD